MLELSAERLVTALTADAAAMHEEEAADTDCNMEECSHCGRQFLEARLGRHQAVCQGRKKAGARRQFNAKAQRLAEGAESSKTKPNDRVLTREGASREERCQRLKRQSEALRSAIKSARTPGDPPAPIEEVPDDRVECPHCSRRFAPVPAERHIAKCKEIRAKPTTLKRMSMASPMAPRLLQKEKEAGDKVLSPPPPAPSYPSTSTSTFTSTSTTLSSSLSFYRSMMLSTATVAGVRPSDAQARRRAAATTSRGSHGLSPCGRAPAAAATAAAPTAQAGAASCRSRLACGGHGGGGDERHAKAGRAPVALSAAASEHGRCSQGAAPLQPRLQPQLAARAASAKLAPARAARRRARRGRARVLRGGR